MSVLYGVWSFDRWDFVCRFGVKRFDFQVFCVTDAVASCSSGQSGPSVAFGKRSERHQNTVVRLGHVAPCVIQHMLAAVSRHVHIRHIRYVVFHERGKPWRPGSGL